MPLEIELVCRSCGQPYVPTRAEILRGPDFYRVCADCRLAIATDDVDAIFKREPDDDAKGAER